MCRERNIIRSHPPPNREHKFPCLSVSSFLLSPGWWWCPTLPPPRTLLPFFSLSLSLSLSLFPHETEMMTPAGKAAAIVAPSSQLSVECCMCGDCGLTDELFQCRICQFRSQHRYCSNLYPKAESYRVCNWCLGQDNRDDGAPAVKTQQQNSSDSNSPRKSGAELEGDAKSGKRVRRGRGGDDDRQQKPPPLLPQVANGGRIKKEKSPEGTSSPTTPVRRRIITKGELEEKLRRTRSEEMAHAVPRQGFRNKVRRYKLLDEVSS